MALVLEGGYNLRTTSVSLGECLKVLLGNSPPHMNAQRPTERAVKDVARTQAALSRYWRACTRPAKEEDTTMAVKEEEEEEEEEEEDEDEEEDDEEEEDEDEDEKKEETAAYPKAKPASRSMMSARPYPIGRSVPWSTAEKTKLIRLMKPIAAATPSLPVDGRAKVWREVAEQIGNDRSGQSCKQAWDAITKGLQPKPSPGTAPGQLSPRPSSSSKAGKSAAPASESDDEGSGSESSDAGYANWGAVFESLEMPVLATGHVGGKAVDMVLATFKPRSMAGAHLDMSEPRRPPFALPRHCRLPRATAFPSWSAAIHMLDSAAFVLGSTCGARPAKVDEAVPGEVLGHPQALLDRDHLQPADPGPPHALLFFPWPSAPLDLAALLLCACCLLQWICLLSCAVQFCVRRLAHNSVRNRTGLRDPGAQQRGHRV